MKAFILAAGLSIVGILSGCAQGTSGTIPSNEIFAVFSIDGDSAGGVVCSASFHHGSGTCSTSLRLTEGDQVTCSDGIKTVTPTESTSAFGEYRYQTTSLAYTPGGTYEIRFSRKDGSAYVASIVLPPAINITAPAVNAFLVKNQEATVTWTPAALGTSTESG
ncbi:MAG: hypothetical protein NDJ90_05375 [Oligoflexia bacterium]|nr:hypothetical protein [Oligoflexia bacterium]